MSTDQATNATPEAVCSTAMLGPVVELPPHPEHGWTWTDTERRFLERWAFDYAAYCVREATRDLNEQWRSTLDATHRMWNEQAARDALTAEQIAALTIMLDHYRGDPRTECLRPLVYGPNA